jgi:adenylyltransferase/sulfurtransferase
MREDRYIRQTSLPGFGEGGQRRLRAASVLIAGCGALGTNSAEILSRAGIGRILLVDFDKVERSNLQRQVLMREGDIGRPKAQAVAEALTEINSDIEISYEITRITPANVERLISGIDMVLDGFDNLPSRYLLNDACVKNGIPWIFATVAGTLGMTMPILPGEGPCLRCLFPEPVPEEFVLTAENAGLLNTIPRAIVALQTTYAMKVLLRSFELPAKLTTYDIWQEVFNSQEILRNENCPCCGKGHFEFLNGEKE